MERRSFVQVIIAFLTSFFGRFTRLGAKPELAAPIPRGTPTEPKGLVSPRAAWYSPPTYEPVTAAESFLLAEQGGIEVMRLKNPAIKRELLGKGSPYPSVERSNPTGPVQAANTDVWRPLDRFEPLRSSPGFPAEAFVLGSALSPATAPKFDVSDYHAYEAVVGKGQEHLIDFDELGLSPETRAQIDANWDELLANWVEDTSVRVIDPTRLS